MEDGVGVRPNESAELVRAVLLGMGVSGQSRDGGERSVWSMGLRLTVMQCEIAQHSS